MSARVETSLGAAGFFEWYPHQHDLFFPSSPPLSEWPSLFLADPFFSPFVPDLYLKCTDLFPKGTDS
jgi:hypothetical protein